MSFLTTQDAWTHFSDHFIHAAGAETLRPTLLPHLYASIVAHACNFGLEQMAHSTNISYQQLAWCTTWYLREETLEAAFTNLVNYHHQLPLSQVWGSGILSSSDGQRFPVSGKNRHARAFPPTLGYGQGLTFYSWTSDQLSQYGSKPVIITARDATYVLDARIVKIFELASYGSLRPYHRSHFGLSSASRSPILTGHTDGKDCGGEAMDWKRARR
jgi:hypothetical protein